jgi:glycosyltransferase involved in cell wall biosynthesis
MAVVGQTGYRETPSGNPAAQAAPRRLRILAVKASLPDSLRFGSNIPAYYMLSFLARRHEVTLYAWAGVPDAISRLPFRAHVQPLDGLSHVGGDLLVAHYGFARASVPWLRGLVRGWRPDVVLGFDYHTLPALAGSPEVARVACLIDNRFLEVAGRLCRPTGWKWSNFKELCWSFWLHWRYARAADAFVFVTRREVAAFRPFTNRPCFVVPNGVDTERFRPDGLPRVRPGVVFVGSLNFEPNVTAVKWLCAHIWPRVRKACPDARLSLVGKSPLPEVLELAGQDGIEVAADVPDVWPYLIRAAVVVAPMLTGGGIKNKILEAWASGAAVVATPRALRGLLARPGHNILVARRPARLADHIVSCLKDPQLRLRLGRNARQTVLAHHTWELAAYRLETCLQKVVRSWSVCVTGS